MIRPVSFDCATGSQPRAMPTDNYRDGRVIVMQADRGCQPCSDYKYRCEMKILWSAVDVS